MPEKTMYLTAAHVWDWCDDMKSSGLARSDTKCASLLGVHRGTLHNMKKDGTDRKTALAMRAALHNLPPYGENF